MVQRGDKKNAGPRHDGRLLHYDELKTKGDRRSESERTIRMTFEHYRNVNIVLIFY